MRDTVAIKKCTSYDQNQLENIIDEIFQLLGGIDRYIKPGMNVTIKANLVTKKAPDEAATTHPNVVYAVAKKVIEKGANVTICDSPGGLYSRKVLEGVYSVCGMNKLEELGTKLNYDTTFGQVNVDGELLKSVTTISPVMNADLVISIPKLKTHGMMVMTGAVKNYFGIIPGTLKAEYHAKMPEFDNFANALVDICLSVKNQLTIVDAVTGMEGAGPTAGVPRNIGCILAATNPFSLDVVNARVIGLDEKSVFTVNNSLRRGLANNIENIDIVGDDIEQFKILDFKIPMTSISSKWKTLNKLLKVINPKPSFNHKACISCGDCARNCPVKVISFKDKKPIPDLDKCIRCFCCQELCPVKAVSIKRPWYTKLIMPKEK